MTFHYCAALYIVTYWTSFTNVSNKDANKLLVSVISCDFLRRLCRNCGWPFVTRYFI